jgi:hypothetical protein
MLLNLILNTDQETATQINYGFGSATLIIIITKVRYATYGAQGLLCARVPHFLRSNTKTVPSDAHFLRSNTKTVPSDALAPTLSPREFQHTCTLEDMLKFG